jgi:hypothetical protein
VLDNCLQNEHVLGALKKMKENRVQATPAERITAGGPMVMCPQKPSMTTSMGKEVTKVKGCKQAPGRKAI